jgi:RNA polymerase sigma-70 factor (ECF subfamily)
MVVDAVDGSSVDLEMAIATLAPRMRLAVDCVYFVGLTVSETAVVMGVAEGTVKSTLFDARARLRTLLEVST